MSRWNSTNPFESVGINVHKLVCFEQHLDLWPHTGKQGMKILFAQIAKSYMHHPRGWVLIDNAFRKIGILADDY